MLINLGVEKCHREKYQNLVKIKIYILIIDFMFSIEIYKQILFDIILVKNMDRLFYVKSKLFKIIHLHRKCSNIFKCYFINIFVLTWRKENMLISFYIPFTNLVQCNMSLHAWNKIKLFKIISYGSFVLECPT